MLNGRVKIDKLQKGEKVMNVNNTDKYQVQNSRHIHSCLIQCQISRIRDIEKRLFEL